MDPRPRTRATPFAKALRSFQVGGGTIADLLLGLRQELAEGTPPDELREVLRARERIEPLPTVVRDALLKLLNNAPTTHPPDSPASPLPFPMQAVQPPPAQPTPPPPPPTAAPRPAPEPPPPSPPSATAPLAAEAAPSQPPAAPPTVAPPPPAALPPAPPQATAALTPKIAQPPTPPPPPPPDPQSRLAILDVDTVILDAPAAPPAGGSPPTTGALLQGRYRLLELIGSGGTSRVYRAEDAERGANEFIAVKVLVRPWIDSAASFQSLEREVAAQAALDHPAIVPLTGCGRDGDFVFLTLDYVVGRPLHTKLAADAAAGTVIDAAEALRIVTAIAGALDYAHRQGLVHGDVKPGNVLIDDHGKVKVIDFGLSRWTARTAGGNAAVTPRYASPQLMARHEPEPSDDVYSLACVAYELLTDTHPFDDRRDSDGGGFPPPLRPGLTTGEHAAIVAALRPDRGERTATIEEFMREFAPRLARPSQQDLTPPDWRRRRRSGAGWLAVAALLCVAALIAWLYEGHPGLQLATTPPATARQPADRGPLTAVPPAHAPAAAPGLAPAPSPAPAAPTMSAAPGAAATPSAPGAAIRDCPKCPLMTVLPAGRFVQGASRTGGRAPAYEQPPHVVLIRHPLALSVDDVTVGEFGAFVDATHRDMRGCDVYDGRWHHLDSADWQHPGFEQGASHPVTCTSWQDATDYARWLTQQTGHRYRLPSASEWEYAARNGGSTDRPWDSGADACANADVADQSAARRYPGWTVFPCSDGYVHTAPVGSFKANALGLHDMLGNVFQWTLDCWRPNYDKAPIDGSPRSDGDCSERELRGGSWFSSPAYVHPSYRNHFAVGYRTSSVGFRVARELPP